MSNLVDYAKHELELIGGQDEPMQQAINKNILDIVQMFSDQGHTGFTANYVLDKLRKVMDFKPLTPLTGAEDEWNGNQNKRLFSVFRGKDGSAYCIDGKIFTDDGGRTWYTSRDSCVPVTFPYTPPDEPIRVYRYTLKNFHGDINAPKHIRWTKIDSDGGSWVVEGEMPYRDNERENFHLSVTKNSSVFWNDKLELGIAIDQV